MPSKHHLAIMIPTKDRPDDVRGLLVNIERQSYQPHQVIVVDGGDSPLEGITQEFPGLTIDYLRVRPPGLTKQKNAGVAVLDPEITVMGVMDDDMIPHDGALETMMAFWEEAGDNLGGACFNLTNSNPADPKLKSILKTIFFIPNRKFGVVLRSGFATPIWHTQENRYVQWLGGGYTFWRRELFDNWKFDEWFADNGLLEDVQFSYRVGKEHDLAVVAEARATHPDPEISNRGEVLLGKRQIVNWVYLVRNNSDLSVTKCLWACVGRTATNGIRGILTFNPSLILRAVGNLRGLSIAAAGILLPLRRSKAKS